jgi:hypothetical protein
MILDPPKTVISSVIINNYTYTLVSLIPHTSVEYAIYCFNDLLCVKTIAGIIEGEQYKEWVDDDWLDRFIKSKIEEL